MNIIENKKKIEIYLYFFNIQVPQVSLIQTQKKMPLPFIAPAVFTAVFSGSTFTGAGVAAGVSAGTAAGTAAGAAGVGVSTWLFLKHLFGVGGAVGAGTATGTGTTGAAVAVKVVAGKALAGKALAGKAVAGKAVAGKAVAGKAAVAPQQGMSNMIYMEDPFLPPIPLPNPVAPLPPLDPLKKAFVDGALTTGATIVGITGAAVALSKSSNENNDIPNTVIPDTEPPNTTNNNSSPVTENDRRRRRQNQRSEPISETTCALCLDEMSDVNNIVVNCGHRFHADCFLNYSRTQNNSVVCPVCRESDIM